MIKTNETWDLKYRPKTWDELLGNDKAAEQMQGEPVRSYILHGPSGTGKTTSIRLLAKEIDAEVLEFDAASLGKDDIENIKKTAQHTSMFNPYKLIILDEAHTLSNQAKDALLKAIEEGNKGTIWAMCTTELHKMAPAIQTRSRIIELKRTNKEEMVEHLNFITKEEGHDLDKYQDKITEIVFFADGKVRQAVKLLETLLKTGELDLPFTQKDAIEVLRATYANDITSIQGQVSGYTNDDIFVLIKLISEFMTAFALHDPTKKDITMEVLVDKYTTISPALVGDLRVMTSAIGSTIHTPAHMGKEKIINRLYSLLETLMKNYNNFDDNRYNIKASLIWYASQLDVWRQEER